MHQIPVFTIFFRLFLSVLFGAVLGAERGFRNRPAGFMTYTLVCMGSALIMLTGEYISGICPDADCMRLGAQVVSGIGFLGAGTIIVTRRDEVRGLTTAAGLWVSAGIGLAVGIGFYEGSVTAFFLYVFSLIVLKKVDTYIKNHARTIEFYMEFEEGFSLRTLSEYAQSHQYILRGIQRDRAKTLHKEIGILYFTLQLHKNTPHTQVIEELSRLDYVEYIREIA